MNRIVFNYVTYYLKLRSLSLIKLDINEKLLTVSTVTERACEKAAVCTRCFNNYTTKHQNNAVKKRYSLYIVTEYKNNIHSVPTGWKLWNRHSVQTNFVQEEFTADYQEYV